MSEWVRFGLGWWGWCGWRDAFVHAIRYGGDLAGNEDIHFRVVFVKVRNLIDKIWVTVRQFRFDWHFGWTVILVNSRSNGINKIPAQSRHFTVFAFLLPSSRFLSTSICKLNLCHLQVIRFFPPPISFPGWNICHKNRSGDSCNWCTK